MRSQHPHRSARPTLKTMLLPQLVPEPNAIGSLNREAIPKLVRKHNDLPPVVSLMRKHVAEHRAARRPGSRPAPSRKFRYLARRFSGKRIGEHAKTLRRAL